MRFLSGVTLIICELLNSESGAALIAAGNNRFCLLHSLDFFILEDLSALLLRPEIRRTALCLLNLCDWVCLHRNWCCFSFCIRQVCLGCGWFFPPLLCLDYIPAIKAMWHHYALHRYTVGLKKLNSMCNNSFLSIEFIEVMFIFTVTCSTSSKVWCIF